jgi:hypothetical protein
MLFTFIYMHQQLTWWPTGSCGVADSCQVTVAQLHHKLQKPQKPCQNHAKMSRLENILAGMASPLQIFIIFHHIHVDVVNF